MSEKIKKVNPWIFTVLITIIVLMAAGYKISLGFYSDDWLIKTLSALLAPAVELTRTSVNIAIELFGGDEFPSSTINISILFTMVGMLLLLFVAPWMMVTGSKTDPETGAPVKSKRWYVSVPVILTAVIVAIMAGIITTYNYTSNKTLIAEGYERDVMRQELVNLSLNAASLVFLPQEEGGGNGHFTNFVDSENGEIRNIRLNDLNRYSAESPYHFEIESQLIDSVMVITIENDDQSETFQSVVSPYEDSPFRLK